MRLSESACVCGFSGVPLCVYLGATLETPRHVCFALFILLCPTPSPPLLASSSGPRLIHTNCPLSFDSMGNQITNGNVINSQVNITEFDNKVIIIHVCNISNNFKIMQKRKLKAVSPEV